MRQRFPLVAKNIVVIRSDSVLNSMRDSPPRQQIRGWKDRLLHIAKPEFLAHGDSEHAACVERVIFVSAQEHDLIGCLTIPKKEKQITPPVSGHHPLAMSQAVMSGVAREPLKATRIGG